MPESSRGESSKRERVHLYDPCSGKARASESGVTPQSQVEAAKTAVEKARNALTKAPNQEKESRRIEPVVEEVGLRQFNQWLAHANRPEITEEDWVAFMAWADFDPDFMAMLGELEYLVCAPILWLRALVSHAHRHPRVLAVCLPSPHRPPVRLYLTSASCWWRATGELRLLAHDGRLCSDHARSLPRPGQAARGGRLGDR